MKTNPPTLHRPFPIRLRHALLPGLIAVAAGLFHDSLRPPLGRLDRLPVAEPAAVPAVALSPDESGPAGEPIRRPAPELGGNLESAPGPLVPAPDGEAAVATARALVREQAVIAPERLLELLRELPPGPASDRIVQLAAKLPGSAARATFLDALLGDSPPRVLAAAKANLVAQTDRDAMPSLLARYQQVADDPEARDRLESVVRAIRQPSSVEALLEVLASDRLASTPPSLVAAVEEALSQIAAEPAAAGLFRHLDDLAMASESDAQQLVHRLAALTAPETRPAVENAALGAKGIRSDLARETAVLALTHFPAPRTTALLGELASDPNPRVRTAASAVLGQLAAVPSKSASPDGANTDEQDTVSAP